MRDFCRLVGPDANFSFVFYIEDHRQIKNSFCAPGGMGMGKKIIVGGVFIQICLICVTLFEFVQRLQLFAALLQCAIGPSSYC